MQALNETAREDAEWILWMDLDTVAVESNIAFPLADYEGKDLVLWIQPDLVLEGDAFRKFLQQFYRVHASYQGPALQDTKPVKCAVANTGSNEESL